MSYLLHVTLPTGHSRRSPRTEVADVAVALMATWLREALAQEAPLPLPVPALSAYTAQALPSPGGLLVTVHGAGDIALPLVTFGVARRSRGAARLWQALRALAPDAAAEPPATPWVGAVPLGPLAHDPAAAEWLGDFERCVAWAWLEREPGSVSGG